MCACLCVCFPLFDLVHVCRGKPGLELFDVLSVAGAMSAANMEVVRASWSQQNVNVLRGSILEPGFSCCPLVSAILGLLALQGLAHGQELSDVFQMSRLRGLVLDCVRTWDVFMQDTGLGSDGMDPTVVLQALAHKLQVPVSLHKDTVVVNPTTFKSVLMQQLPMAYLLTTLPDDPRADNPTTGNTFALVASSWDQQQVQHFLFDSHDHPTQSPGGAMLVRIIGPTEAATDHTTTFLFGPGSLLDQLGFDKNSINMTAFTLQQSGGPSSSSSPSVAQDAPPTPLPAVSQSRPLALLAPTPAASQCRQPAPPWWGKICEARLQALPFTLNHQQLSAIQEKPAECAGDWAVGCLPCAAYYKHLQKENLAGAAVKDIWRCRGPHDWAKFQVCKQTSLTVSRVTLHGRSPFHALAVRWMQAGEASPKQNMQDAQPALQGISSGDRAGKVPTPARFLDVLGQLRDGMSGRAMERRVLADQKTSLQPTSAVKQDRCAKTSRKTIHSFSAALFQNDQGTLLKARRLAFSEDEADQRLLVRGRLVVTHPRVDWQEILLGVKTDFGFQGPDHAKATWDVFKSFCTVRRGRRIGAGMRGLADVVCPRLLAKAKEITFCAATDGLEPAKDGIQLLKSEGKLPNLRYQWRDRPHTTRSIIRMTFRMCPESEKLLEMLITGPRSFAKRACHSHRFRQIWLRKQQEDPAAFFSVLTDLSYAEKNFDNRSAPMTTFLLKLGPALGVLGDLAEDQDLSHSSDAAWAREVALQLVGPEGFAQLVIFAIDCDFAVATNLLTRLQDKSSPDIAVAQEEVHDCVEICRALFDEGLIFEEAPNGTYTNALLQSLQKTSHEIRLGRGQVGVLGWPNHSESALKRPVEHARKLFQLAKSFFDLNYPGYTWRAKFATFTPSCW